MGKQRWDPCNISWYQYPKKGFSYFVLTLQSSFLMVALLQLLPFFAPCSVVTMYIPCNCVADTAGIMSIIATLLIGIISLTSLKTCAVPMTVLYRWVYPNFEYSFILTLVLLVFSFCAGRQKAPSLAVQCFVVFCFLGGIVGLVYVMRMCWTFTFSPDRWKKTSIPTSSQKSTTSGS